MDDELAGARDHLPVLLQRGLEAVGVLGTDELVDLGEPTSIVGRHRSIGDPFGRTLSRPRSSLRRASSRRASRSASDSESKVALSRWSIEGSTLSNAFTLTTAYVLPSISLVTSGTAPQREQM